MKKLTRKLFLSVAALAVCAATLVSTTFAWYVSNQTASATGVNAATATVSDGGSVYISKDGSKFYSSIAFTTDDLTNTTYGNQNGAFIPLTTDDAEAFVDVEGTANTSAYMVVNMWLKADADCSVTPMLKLTNTTAALPEKVAYQAITTAVQGGQTYTIDAAQALRMAVAVDDADATIYDVLAIAKDAAGTAAYTIVDGSVAEDDLVDTTIDEDTLEGAHGYYAAIMGEAPSDVEAAAATESWGTIALTADTAVKLTFVIWLDGADISCYDGCAGQSFQFDFDFTIAS